MLEYDKANRSRQDCYWKDSVKRKEINELISKTGTDLQILKITLVLPKEKSEGEE